MFFLNITLLYTLFSRKKEYTETRVCGGGRWHSLAKISLYKNVNIFELLYKYM